MTPYKNSHTSSLGGINSQGPRNKRNIDTIREPEMVNLDQT